MALGKLVSLHPWLALVLWSDECWEHPALRWSLHWLSFHIIDIGRLRVWPSKKLLTSLSCWGWLHHVVVFLCEARGCRLVWLHRVWLSDLRLLEGWAHGCLCQHRIHEAYGVLLLYRRGWLFQLCLYLVTGLFEKCGNNLIDLSCKRFKFVETQLHLLWLNQMERSVNLVIWLLLEVESLPWC